MQDTIKIDLKWQQLRKTWKHQNNNYIIGSIKIKKSIFPLFKINKKDKNVEYIRSSQFEWWCTFWTCDGNWRWKHICWINLKIYRLLFLLFWFYPHQSLLRSRPWPFLSATLVHLCGGNQSLDGSVHNQTCQVWTHTKNTHISKL